MIKKIKFKGIKFYNFFENDFQIFIKKKGLFLFPSGPGLSSLDKKSNYFKSLLSADYNFFDSGFFVILLFFLKKINVNKFSGYKFIKLYINYLKKNKNLKILSINPSKKSSQLNKKLFQKIKLKKNRHTHYVAPIYNSKKLSDGALLKKINIIKPDHILINLGGNTQEVLGLYIKKKINYKCNIFCTGAAISFFTGEQAPINDFIDRNYLGWLFRIIFKPYVFLPRYLKSIKLFFLVLTNKVIIINK